MYGCGCVLTGGVCLLATREEGRGVWRNEDDSGPRVSGLSSTSRPCMERASWSGSAVHVGKGDIGRQRLAGGPWYDDVTPPSSFTGECATEKREKGGEKKKEQPVVLPQVERGWSRASDGGCGPWAMTTGRAWGLRCVGERSEAGVGGGRAQGLKMDRGGGGFVRSAQCGTPFSACVRAGEVVTWGRGRV